MSTGIGNGWGISRLWGTEQPASKPESTLPRPSISGVSTITSSTESPSPPSLEKKAQLTGVKKAQNLGYNLFWGTISLPLTIKTWTWDVVTNRIGREILQSLATKSMGQVMLPDPDTPLKRLLSCLQHLNQTLVSNLEISPELRASIIRLLDHFIENQKTYLREARDPKTSCFKFAGMRSTLDYEQEEKFNTLSKDLKEGAPINQSFVADLINIIHERWMLERKFQVSKMTKELLGTAQTSGTLPPTEAPPVEQDRSRFYETLTPKKPKPVAPENAIPEIEKQIDQLKSLGFKIILAFLILPKDPQKKPTAGLEKSKESLEKSTAGLEESKEALEKSTEILLSELIKESEECVHHEKDSNEIFQDLILNKLDILDLNFFHRTWNKCWCKLLAPSILYILDHVLEQTKNDLLYLVGLKPEERLKLIVDMAIVPGSEFLNALQTFYIAFSRDPMRYTGTLENERNHAMANITIQDRHRHHLTPQILLNRLIGTFMNRYSPRFDWTSTAAEYFDKRSVQATRLSSKFWFYGWARISGFFTIAFAPFQWCLHKGVRKIIKITATYMISSKLLDSKGSSWDFGRLALQSVYRILLEKIRDKKLTPPTAGASTVKLTPAIQQTAFVDKSVKRRISSLVSEFLTILAYNDATKLELADGKGAGFLRELKTTGEKILYKPFIQKATEQIIEGFQIFSKRASFATVISEVLTDVNGQCKQINMNRPDDDLAIVENEFYSVAKGAIETGIRQVIKEVEDPSQRIQLEADIFIKDLRDDISNFHIEYNNSDEMTFDLIKQLVLIRQKLLFNSFEMRYDRAQEGTNTSTMFLINQCKNLFFDLRKPISEAINQLVLLATDRKIGEEAIYRLQQLQKPLRVVDFPFIELQGALQRVDVLLYPEKVRKVISSLKTEFQENGTAKQKKDNMQRTINLIKMLESAILASIRENQELVDEKTDEIDDLYSSVQLKVDGLNKWAKDLQSFKCETGAEQAGLQKLIAALNKYTPELNIEGKISGIIIPQLEGFFDFLGKDHNVKGPIWFIIKAYLERPIDRQYDKIVGQVRPKKKPALSERADN